MKISAGKIFLWVENSNGERDWIEIPFEQGDLRTVKNTVKRHFKVNGRPAKILDVNVGFDENYVDKNNQQTNLKIGLWSVKHKPYNYRHYAVHFAGKCMEEFECWFSAVKWALEQNIWAILKK